MRIVVVLTSLFLLCCCTNANEKEESIPKDEKTTTIEKTSQSISFNDYINKIPIERFPKSFTYNPNKIYSYPKLSVNATIYEQVSIPDEIAELISNKNDLKDKLKNSSFLAISRIILNDSYVSIRYQVSTDIVKTEENTYRFLVTYNRKGEIISVLPTKYHKTISSYKVQCFSVFNEKNKITRYYIYEDTTNVINNISSRYIEGNGYHRHEFAESLIVRKDGMIDTIKPITNVLESFAKSYVKVGIEDRIFKVYKPCKDTFHIINFVSPKNGRYYHLNYKDENKEFKFEIVLSRMIGTSGIQNEFDWKYKGKYIHLWLRDIESGKYDNSFLAIGTSGDSRVHEFHFPKSSAKIGTLFTDYKNLLNGKIKIKKPDCDD